MDASTLPAGLISGSSGPLYQRLAEGLRGAVRRGEVGAGSKLPSERDLARWLGVSRTTVIGAYRLLREEGLLESVRGSGTRVVACGHWIGPAVPAATMPSAKLTGAPAVGVVDLSGSVVAGPEALLPRLTADPIDLRELATDFGYQPLGLPSLRARIAARYTRLGLPTTADEVLVTSGAQQAISLLFTLFGRDGGVIATENPTYAGALDAARAAGATLLALPTDSEGLKVRPLREALTRSPISLLYVMTTCQNPTGTSMSTQRRTEIARLAEHAGVPVVDDTTLADLVFEGRWQPLPTAAGVTVGSLSKLFWPGLRIGWLRAPRTLMPRLARLKVVADLGSSHVGQQLAARLLPVSGDMATARREQLTARLDLMSELLRSRLPTWSWTRPSGGPFLWVRLPYSDGESFAQLALTHGVQVLPGARTSPDRGFADHLRLSFVAEPADLRVAVDRLTEAWTAFESIPGSGHLPFGIMV
ncbi:PLP-dependent aminotransferase family protein [Streptomyces sp. NPDC014685]|jgi:DNA-binding transcriptional MocR family regulator|uniref:aminotransferase-like domain-containing protein n=1 Tax=Streptomyces sp. NPDC014685 TaxID=3364881 RepID=UPI0036F5D2CE